MPAIMTHDFFGRDALATLQGQTFLTSDDERQAFLLGNQGPDPLFYLAADPLIDKSNQVGNLMHHVRPAKLIASFRDALSMLSCKERSIGVAYTTGFLCHYLLDRSMHPLVYSQQFAICDAGVEGLDRSDGTYVHAEIERDLDEMVLYATRHATIAMYKPYREILRASDEVLATIDKLYFYAVLWTYNKTLDFDCYTQAVKSFRLVQRFFYAPLPQKRCAVATVEKLFSPARYSLYAAMAHRVRPQSTSVFDNRQHHAWKNPFTQEVSHKSFWDIYQDAVAEVAPSVEKFLKETFDERTARELTQNLNFSGMPTDPESFEEPQV